MKKIQFVLCLFAFVFAVSAVQARPTMSYPDHSTLQPRQSVDGEDRKIILWVRNTTATNGTVNAVLRWKEFW